MSEKFKTSIGGQALIEGVMMQGPDKMGMAVRKPNGEIHTETWEGVKQTWYRKVPFLRGVVAMVTSMITGYKCLMRSAEISGMDDDDMEPSKFEKWLSDKLGANIMTVVAVLALIMGLGLAMLLFVIIPTSLGGLVYRFYPAVFLRSIVEGISKIVIFIAYLVVVSKTPEIKRVFQYHGGEHKSIACYEAGLELTVDNVRKMSRFHPRCGTSFILNVLIISILVFTVVSVNGTFIRILLKLLLMPVIVGLAYEINRYIGRNDNAFTRAIRKPGLLLQRVTTSEPDDSQMEVAITALKLVLPEVEGSDRW